jgi:PTH1 family peptidyl-tRNA hydrolase
MGPVAVIGLGNPGPSYLETRHNLGFRVVEELARRWDAPFVPGAGPYEEARAREPLSGIAVILVAPQTFMNGSGEAVADVVGRYAVSPGALLIVVDDFWLPLGRLRFRTGGSDGGHHGLASVIEALGTTEFPRLRLGIGRPEMPPKGAMAEFVLARFDPDERPPVAEMVSRAADAAAEFIRNGKAVPNNPPAPEDGSDAA